jgi:hypothetical protein
MEEQGWDNLTEDELTTNCEAGRFIIVSDKI